MSERDDDESVSSASPPSPSSSNTIIFSLKIFLRNKQIFLAIFALTTLPLSIFIFSLSLSVRPLSSRIRYLEYLALLAPTRFEARQIWQQSRAAAVSLLRLKSLFLLPTSLLSLAAAVSSISSTALSASGRRPSLLSAASAVQLHWRRPLVTSICVYAFTLAYSLAPRTLAALFPSPGLKLAVLLVGCGFEIYLMAVLGLGVVVSVMEERVGWEAIRVGWDLIEERRVFAWALSGLLAGLTGVIGWGMEGSGNPYDKTAGEDLSRGVEATVKMVWLSPGQFGWAFLYGLVVVWGYVVTTVFYCDCRKRHPIKGEDEMVAV